MSMTNEQMDALEKAFQDSQDREIILHILLDTMTPREIENGLQSRLDSDTPENFELNLGVLARTVSYYNSQTKEETPSEVKTSETDDTMYI